MKISYNWLKDYVDIKIPAEELAHILTMAGLSVDSIEKKGDDSILEVEITSNRPDWLSYIGVAREVAAITGRKLKVPYSVRRTTHNVIRNTILVKVEDKKLCPRYTARIIRNVKVGESPEWLKKKIEAIGLRSVNNIVDITNFCLFETGEPMHAFDLDNIKGNTVIIRKAAKGEKIVVIDGTERLLDDSMLVIADSSSPIAIAGIMGGIKTEVGLSTKNILLEAAYFDPTLTRRTARKLALSSESSYRFERKVDIDNIKYASDRATQLILEAAGADAEDFIDIGSVKRAKINIGLSADRLNKILGVEIEPSKIKSILASLGLKVKPQAKGILKFEIPNFRQDLQNEIDLVEEVARIYGYDNIPETLPPVVEKGPRLPLGVITDNMIQETLKGLSLSQIVTYSLLGRKALSLCKIDDKDVVVIKNPLSVEQEILRPSSIPGMLGAIRYNINRKNNDLKLFELGKVYFKEGASSFKERRNLTIGITGEVHDRWVGRTRKTTLFDLKGILEALLSALGLGEFLVRETENNTFSSSTCASIEIKGEPVGIIGQIGSSILKNFDIKDKVYILEIDCEKILNLITLEKHFKEPIRYPSVLRDISIVIDNSISNNSIVSSITESAGPLLKKVQLIDRYHGGQIPDGKTSLTYRLEYQDISRTLEDKEVQEAHSRVVRALENNLGAKPR
jgi:phenylalanyl-tRNA synthetase beta chain